jgi:cytoskeletal protein RodZ
MSAAAARSQSPQLPQSPPNETAISVNLYTESFANAQAVATPLAKSDQTSSPRKNLSPLGSPRTSEDASRFPLWLRTLLIAVVVVGTSLLAWQFLAQQSTVKPHIAVKPATGVVQVAKPASATLVRQTCLVSFLSFSPDF